MTSDGMILTIAFGGFIIFFTSFSILNRKWVTYPIYTIFSSLILGFIVSIVLSFTAMPVFLLTLLVLFLYSLLVSVYIFAFYLNIDSSLHMRIFQEFAKMDSKGLTYSELLRFYNRRVIVKKRLEWLVDSGEIGLVGNLYHLRRHHSLLLLREKLLLLLGKLYGREEEFSNHSHLFQD